MAFDEKQPIQQQQPLQQQPLLQQPVIGYPTYQQQQLYQQMQMPMQPPQAILQTIQATTSVIANMNGQMVPMSKIKIRHDTNCVGNYTSYKTEYPQGLQGMISPQEFEVLIKELNEIAQFKKYPILLTLFVQFTCIIPLIIAAVNNNIGMLYTFLILTISMSLVIVFLSLYLAKRAANKMECKVTQLNQFYASRNIRFKSKASYVNASGKKFHIKLSIHFPTLGAFVVQQQPPQMYYTQPPQQQQQTLPIYQSQTNSNLNTIDNNNNNEKQPLI